MKIDYRLSPIRGSGGPPSTAREGGLCVRTAPAPIPTRLPMGFTLLDEISPRLLLPGAGGPRLALERGQDFNAKSLALRYAARAKSSEWLSFATILCSPNNGGDPNESVVFTRSSILFRPRQNLPARLSAARKAVVEPPGTAPGSDPLITRAFYRYSRLAPAT